MSSTCGSCTLRPAPWRPPSRLPWSSCWRGMWPWTTRPCAHSPSRSGPPSPCSRCRRPIWPCTTASWQELCHDRRHHGVHRGHGGAAGRPADHVQAAHAVHAAGRAPAQGGQGGRSARRARGLRAGGSGPPVPAGRSTAQGLRPAAGQDLRHVQGSGAQAAHAEDARARRGDFLERATNVLMFGLPGVGKSHVAAAIGHALVDNGHSVLFAPAYRVVQDLLAAKRDLALPRALRRLDVFDLLILDDIGYVQQSQDEAEVLFTMMAERYERRSLLITSNLVFSEWDRIFKNPMTTAAAIDRVVHHSVILEF